jgi:hypothetical protein
MKIERRNTKGTRIIIRVEEQRKSLIAKRAGEIGASTSELIRLVLEREFPLLDEPSVAKEEGPLLFTTAGLFLKTSRRRTS